MHLPRRMTLMLSAATIALVAFGATGCSGTSTPPESSSTPGSSTPGSIAQLPLPLRVAVVGDSNTTGLQGTLDQGVANGIAYISQITGSQITFAGGWARDGATSSLMAQQVTPVDDVDVLIVMAGTNNPASGVDSSQLDADLKSIVSTIDPKYTVIEAVPPISSKPDVAVGINDDLKLFASENGWQYHDAWSGLRTADNKWLPQYMVDGIHTNKAGYGAMGADLKQYLLATFAAG